MSTEQNVSRKLSAILSADVKGYSILMADDEIHTINTLKAYRQIISELITEHSGRVVDSPGDNILAEFRSAVDAVGCAVKIQEKINQENARYVDDKKIQFRIGVNIGDVVQDGDRIYGNGVNVAARIEGLSESGGVCISRNAYDHIKNKLKLGYEYLGDHEVKNIKDPVRVYKVLMDSEDAGKLIGEKPKRAEKKWILPLVIVTAIIATSIGWYFFQSSNKTDVEPAAIERMAYQLPDKPSIAVLPFDNLSGDPEQEYFSDGLTEEIITAFSKVPGIFVIARNSTVTYKGKPVKVQQVAEDLGVRYVLEGSVRKGKDKVRITAQLIDALTGHHLWAERYDRDLKDIFAVQDEITKNILTALQVKLTSGEYVRLLSKGTENLQAYLIYWQALEKIGTETKDGNFLARQLLKEVIALDPKFPAAYVLLGFTHTSDAMLGASKSPKESFAKAMELAKKAIALDDSFPTSYALLGWTYIWFRKHEEAITEYERALALAPNSSFSNIWMSLALRYAGRHKEAVGFAEKAIRLNPIPSCFTFRSLGVAYMFNGRYEEAIDNFKKALNVAPNDLMTYINLAVAYIEAGKEDEARAAVAEIIRINPKLSLSEGKKLLNYKIQADNDLYIDALGKAGLPE